MITPDCPVCKARLSSLTPVPDTRTFTIDCPRCGLYLITFEALGRLQRELGRHRLRWAITSHAIRRLYAIQLAGLRVAALAEHIPHGPSHAVADLRFSESTALLHVATDPVYGVPTCTRF